MAEIDYVSIVDSLTLKDVEGDITAPVLVAMAVKIGSTRLIRLKKGCGSLFKRSAPFFYQIFIVIFYVYLPVITLPYR